MTTKTDERAKEQAQAQVDSIVEMIKALEKGEEIDGQDPTDCIQEDPLSVEVRSDWHTPGEDSRATEYCILLCTGGPAVRIRGDLTQYSSPETATIEYQDWFTPWERLLPLEDGEHEALLTYAQQFYFGD